MYFELKGYNSSSYTDFNDAKARNGIYSTPSTIDCIALEGGSLSGLYDLQEVVTLFISITGVNDIIFGIEKDDKFYSLSKIISNASKLDSSTDVNLESLLSGAEE